MKIKKPIIVIAIMALVAAISLPAFAESPNFNPKDALGRSVYVAPGTATNVLGPVIRLRRDRPLNTQIGMYGTNAAASAAVTAVFRYSNDPNVKSSSNASWSTTGNTSFAATGTGAASVNAVGSVTNTTFPLYAQLWYLTNAAAANGGVFVTNMPSGIWDP